MMKYIKIFENYSDYRFAYTCVHPESEEELEAIIDDLNEESEVTAEEFMKHVPYSDIENILPKYQSEEEMKKDWHMRYFIGSIYFDPDEEFNRELREEEGDEYLIHEDGEFIEYAVIVHSAIEHVWKK